VGLEDDSNGHNFAFTSPPPLALTERESFKAQLTTIISNNRAARDNGAIQPPQAGVQAPTSSSNAAVRRAPVPAPSRASDSRAESVSSHRGTPVNDPINDFHVRKKVLLNTPELAALHRELVMSGQITETEFWEGREVCDTPTTRHIFDVGFCPSNSCWPRPLPTPKRRADQVS
jgi:transcription initiation factor TFIIH subunit 1